MRSSLSTSSLSFPCKIPIFFNHRFNFCFSTNPFVIRPRNAKPFSLYASIAEKSSSLEYSWIAWNKPEPDEYNGWSIEKVEPNPVKKKRFPAFLVTGVGASVVVLLGLLAYFSVSDRGFRFRLRNPVDAVRGSVPFLAEKNDIANEEVSPHVSSDDAEVPVENLDGVPEAIMETETSPNTTDQRKERIIVPLAADYAQEEAMLALKKLKIIEDDARADELCTRREYARWLVLANSQLERSRKHRIISSAALSGSRIAAFDDVGVEDPDFEYIQSLAEAGVFQSKLSDGNSGWNSDDVEGKKHAKFLPESFISREDLISWKAKIEYEVMPGINEEMLMKNIGFLDSKKISANVVRELFVDVLADEKSILKAVFGQSKRLQPSKPCTKGQAAVALTSGRMTEFIEAEILRLEAENASRQSELEEIMQEVLERGEIQHFWEQKLEEIRCRGLEVEMDYRATIDALEQEKTFQENASAELVKQKAALDCQKQLLSSLKAEVDDMTERLALEKATCNEERRGMQDVLRDLQVTYEGLLDTKSILEAELEALKKLRSWVEEGARKSQSSAKVLEEAGRRWKWSN